MRTVIMKRSLEDYPFTTDHYQLNANHTMIEKFEYIFNNNTWGGGCNNETKSGPGSVSAYAGRYYDELVDFIVSRKVKSIVDIPCGDMNWSIGLANYCKYSACDISKSVINFVNGKYPFIPTYQIDITKDKIPEGEMVHVRHLLFHLSLIDALKAFKNILLTDSKYVCITTHFLPDEYNYDIETGGFRLLDLSKYPFNLPAPKYGYLLDYNGSADIPMASGVWSKRQISKSSELKHYIRKYT